LPRPGNRCQGLLWESGPSMRLGRSPWGLGQPSSKGVSPTRGLGWSTPVSVPLTDDPARLRPTRFSFQANSAPVHADTATPGLGSSKSGRGVPLTKLEKPRTTRPTEPRDSYASGIRISHSSPLHGATHACEAVQTTNRRVLVLENEGKHDSVPKIHTCSGPDSHNEQKHWHSKCHYKQNSGSTSAGMNNPTQWGGGLRSNRRPTNRTPSPASAAATTTTSAPGGRTAATLTSGRMLLPRGPRPCPNS
jgi:hypothetical protein